ncbi:hypothetical protein G6F46_014452 [Rhizopus delemar]|nr:hypothetical protein G6F46_014452 [Rhizopus delemar]
MLSITSASSSTGIAAARVHARSGLKAQLRRRTSPPAWPGPPAARSARSPPPSARRYADPPLRCRARCRIRGNGGGRCAPC